MAQGGLTPGVAYTAPLVFLDANGVATTPPTGGSVTSSNSGDTVALSADGSHCNLTMGTASENSTLTYVAGSVTFTTEVSSAAPVPGPAASGSFGTFVEGTTP